MALADPEPGNEKTVDRPANDSIGDSIREALGNGEKASVPRRPPQIQWGNGRPGKPGEEKPLPGGEKPPTKPGEVEPPIKPGEGEPPTKPPEGEPPCDEDPGTGNPPPSANPPQSGGGGGAIVQLPSYKPPNVPDMHLPDELQPGEPGGPAVLDAGAGVAAAGIPVGPAAPIVLPVIVAPPIGLGAGAGGAGTPGGAPPGPPPGAPRAVTAEPLAGRVPPPANAGSNAPVPASSYRIGYTEYLRTAGLPQVAALAVPGLAGILVLTGAGGLVGYRQAKAGHAVRVGSTARFMR